MSILLFLLGTATIPLYLIYFPGTSQTIPNLLFLLAGAAAIVDWWIVRGGIVKLKLPYHPFWIPSILILIGGLSATFFNSVNGKESLVVVLKQWFVFSIWMGVAVDAVVRGYSKVAINLLIVGALLTSAVALLDYTIGLNLGPHFISSTHPVANVPGYGSSGNGRFAGTFGHSNAQALFLTLVLPIVFDRWLGRARTWKLQDFIWLACFGVIAAAIVLTGSVSGYLGAFTTCSVVLLVRLKNFGISGKIILPILIGTVSILLLGLAILFIPAGFEFITTTDKVQNLLGRDGLNRVIEGSGPVRLETYFLALQYISNSPIIGVGLDNASSQLQVSSGELLQVHNTILQLWFTSGILGVIGVVIIYWQALLLALSRIRTSLKSVQLPDRVGIAAATLGFLLIDMTKPGIDERQKWLVIALLYGSMYVREKITKPNITVRDEVGSSLPKLEGKI